MARPICFDLTHLVARLGFRAPSGIDKVDLAYGRHFGGRDQTPAVHYGLLRPHTISPARARQIVELAEKATWEVPTIDHDPAFEILRDAILAGERSLDQATVSHQAPLPAGAAPGYAWQVRRLRLLNDGGGVPHGAIYLNAAQLVLEIPRFFKWIHARPDVKTVFVLHDLLPLDYPEYFRPGYEALFNRRLATAFTHGKAFIVTTEAVRQRVAEELERRGVRKVPIHVEPLPSSLGIPEPSRIADPELANVPYFVVVGTIEPRKNHLLLLNIWRRMAEECAKGGAIVPKLVIVGVRGWENEQVVDVLDRGLLTRPHVIEAAGLSSDGLARIVANARALLMPSFAEGYGLPLVEALSLGTPVIATDAAVFREVTQNCATYRGPLDGIGWRDAILALTKSSSSAAEQARARVRQFRSPTWPRYFSGVEAFLADI